MCVGLGGLSGWLIRGSSDTSHQHIYIYVTIFTSSSKTPRPPVHLYAAGRLLGQPQPRVRLPGGRRQRAAEGPRGPPEARGALGQQGTAPEALAAWI